MIQFFFDISHLNINFLKGSKNSQEKIMNTGNVNLTLYREKLR